MFKAAVLEQDAESLYPFFNLAVLKLKVQKLRNLWMSLLLFFPPTGKLVVQTFPKCKSCPSPVFTFPPCWLSHLQSVTTVVILRPLRRSDLCSTSLIAAETNSNPLLSRQWVLPPDQVRLAVPAVWERNDNVSKKVTCHMQREAAGGCFLSHSFSEQNSSKN